MNVKHYHADTYVRESFINAGEFVSSYVHSYDHNNVLAIGTIVIQEDGIMTKYTGPCCIQFKAGVKYKMLAIDNVAWYCVHKDTSEIPDLDKGE